MRDTAAHRQADCFLFLLFTFSISFLFCFFASRIAARQPRMKHCPLFLGLWANWIGLGIHGMAWQLDYLISPTLVYIFCYPFLFFFCFFSCLGSGFIFFFGRIISGFGIFCSCKKDHVMRLVLHTLSFGNVLFGLAFFIDSAFGLWPRVHCGGRI